MVKIPAQVKITERQYRLGKLPKGWQSIGGSYKEPELDLLYQMALLAPNQGCAVELGSYCGRSSWVIAQVSAVAAVTPG